MSSLSDVLSTQHQRVIELLDNAEQAPESATLRALANEIIGHTVAEEEIVYPMRRSPVGWKAQALEEHAIVRYALERLLDSPPGNVRFVARLRMLRELLVQHCEREERARLPAMEKALGARRSRVLAERVASRFLELVGRRERRHVRDEG